LKGGDVRHVTAPDGLSRGDELREVLDGLVERRLLAFAAETDATEPRVLFVPFHVAMCPVMALLICRRTGLLRSKLAEMSAEDANFIYLTTIAKRDPEN
jgi:hypothetical protein